jgi:hypothetical protein
MQVKVLKEAGYEEALLGMAFSYRDQSIPLNEWWDDAKKNRAIARAESLCDKDGGHNKFLESIRVWVYIQASRAWWQEFDTYRIDITKQSTSTMHTLSKRYAKRSDFEAGTLDQMIDVFNALLDTKPDIATLKENLPEGFLQERIITTSYKTLRYILEQRANHRYKHWNKLQTELYNQLEHKELLPWPVLKQGTSTSSTSIDTGSE